MPVSAVIRNLDEIVGAGQAGYVLSLLQEVVSRLSRPLGNEPGRDGAKAEAALANKPLWRRQVVLELAERLSRRLHCDM